MLKRKKVDLLQYVALSVLLVQETKYQHSYYRSGFENPPLDLPVCCSYLCRQISISGEFVSKVISEPVQKNVYPLENVKTVCLH